MIRDNGCVTDFQECVGGRHRRYDCPISGREGAEEIVEAQEDTEMVESESGDDVLRTGSARMRCHWVLWKKHHGAFGLPGSKFQIIR